MYKIFINEINQLKNKYRIIVITKWRVTVKCL